MKKRLIAMCLCLTAVLSHNTFLLAQKPQKINRAQAAAFIALSAQSYATPNALKTILVGDDEGKIKEKEPATVAQTVVMLHRAFGDLPKPVGDNLTMAAEDVSFTDVPHWAQAAVRNFTAADLLEKSEDGLLHCDAPVAKEQLEQWIGRIKRYLGTNLKDDFYTYYNKARLDASVLLPGEQSTGTFEDTAALVQIQLCAVLDKLVQEKQEKGTPEQKLSDFYQAAQDWNNRNSIGLKPLQPYIERIRLAQTVAQLVQIDSDLVTETGHSFLFSFIPTTDLKDNQKKVIALYTVTPAGENFIYQKEATSRIYKKYMARLLTLGGEEEAEAVTNAEAIFEMEKSISLAGLSTEEAYDIDKSYHIVSLQEAEEFFPELNLGKIMKKRGIKKTEQIVVHDLHAVEKAADLLTQKNLPILKEVMIFQLLDAVATVATKDMLVAALEYRQALYGVEGAKSDKKAAVRLTTEYLAQYLDEAYSSQYFDAQAKEEVEKMVQDFIEVYKETIMHLDWMSQSTKEMAIKKLDYMTVKVGYPEKVEPMLLDLTLRPRKEGGSLLEYVLCCNAARYRYMIKNQQSIQRREVWSQPSFTVNASYFPSINAIEIPAGILQRPFYSKNAAPAHNYGAIGTVIAHELSHAFDNYGSRFDEKGNAADWWNKEDYEAFCQKWDELIDYYDVEIAVGIQNNGRLTLGENIADIGGMHCALKVMEKTNTTDYKAFFERNALMWFGSGTYNRCFMQSQMDVHSNKRLRVNLTVSCFEQFYEAFDIKEGDGMYVAPENRIQIW